MSSFRDLEPDQMGYLAPDPPIRPAVRAGLGQLRSGCFVMPYGWQFSPGWIAGFQSAPGFSSQSSGRPPLMRRVNSAARSGYAFVSGKLRSVPAALFHLFREHPVPCRSLWDPKGRVFPAQFLAGQRHFLFTQRRAVRLFLLCSASRSRWWCGR